MLRIGLGITGCSLSRKCKHRRGRCCWAYPRYGLALAARRQVTWER